MNTPCQAALLPEWAPQSAILLTWPHKHGDWDDGLDEVEATYCHMARAIAAREKLVVACHDEVHCAHIERILETAKVSSDQFRLYLAPSNDIWVRDHGPLTVQCNMELSLLDFQFNGWGEKYAYELDNQVTTRLGQQMAFDTTPLHPQDIILEGGSLETDGSGTVLTTTRCLLSENRNGLSKVELEKKLAAPLGIKRFLWLDHGFLEGDDTDGHIDTLARFCDRETIAYARCEDKSDSHWQELDKMKHELEQFKTATNRSYKLVPLPIPQAIVEKGIRLPANYCNFLIINGAVLVPVYDDPMDQVAIEQLQTCFPDREMIPVNSLPLIRQFGGVHCASMQLPDGVVD